jgi:hypothetical protein
MIYLLIGKEVNKMWEKKGKRSQPLGSSMRKKEGKM